MVGYGFDDTWSRYHCKNGGEVEIWPVGSQSMAKIWQECWHKVGRRGGCAYTWVMDHCKNGREDKICHEWWQGIAVKIPRRYLQE